MAFELIYQDDEDGRIFWLHRNEAKTMRAAGLTVRTKPSRTATTLLRRGPIMDEATCPKDPRYLQSPQIYSNYCCVHRWYEAIADLTIPTVFVNELGAEATKALEARGWKRAFVKNCIKSLVKENPLESVYPDVSFEELERGFAECSYSPRPFALRQYLPADLFENEKRYWVIGHTIRHSSGKIPEIVREAAARLAVFGGVFYTIDATPDLIVEVNGGESSDRKTDNRAKDFAFWIKEAFH